MSKTKSQICIVLGVLSFFAFLFNVNICAAQLPAYPKITMIDITKKQAKEYNKNQGVPILDMSQKEPIEYHKKYPYTEVKRQPSEWKYHEDLINYTKMRLKDPNSFQEISYGEMEDDYAILAYTATNSFGGRVRGYTKGVWIRYKPYIIYSSARKDYTYFPGGEDVYLVKMY